MYPLVLWSWRIHRLALPEGSKQQQERERCLICSWSKRIAGHSPECSYSVPHPAHVLPPPGFCGPPHLFSPCPHLLSFAGRISEARGRPRTGCPGLSSHHRGRGHGKSRCCLFIRRLRHSYFCPEREVSTMGSSPHGYFLSDTDILTSFCSSQPFLRYGHLLISSELLCFR